MACGGPKTSSKVQIIFSFRSFESSGGILRNQKLIIGLDSFSNQPSIYLANSDNTSLCIDYHLENCFKLTVILFVSMLPNLKGH